MARTTPSLVGFAVVTEIVLAIAAWLSNSPALGWAFVLSIIVVPGVAFLLRYTARWKPVDPPASQSEPAPLENDVRGDRSEELAQVKPVFTPEDPPVWILPPEPDLTPLLALMAHYREAYEHQADELAVRGEHLEPHRQGVRAAFSWNPDQIRAYLEDVVAHHEPERFARLPSEVDRAAELLTLGCWCVGYAYRQAQPSASTLLLLSPRLSLALLAEPQRDLVEPAIAHAHRLFASVLNGYYASDYGRAVRRERDGHFIDVYSAFTHAALRSFRLGLQPPPAKQARELD